MDVLSIFKVIADFFIDFCSVVLDFGGGIRFTVGALFIWCGIAAILVGVYNSLS